MSNSSADNQVAFQKSLELLRAASTPFGFVASTNDISNYSRIWSRDATITGLAALLSGDEGLVGTFKNSISTLFDHQHTTGFIPSNVNPATSIASYGGTVGRTDNVSWAAIGLLSYVLFTDDFPLLKKYRAQLEKCFQLLNAWEYNGKGLVYVPQSGDWADEYVQHGYILYNQLLRVWALELAAKVFNQLDYQTKAAEIRLLIETNFWKHEASKEYYAANMLHQMDSAPDSFWLMGFNPSRIYPQFDLQANSLALLLNVGNSSQKSKTVSYLSDFIKRQQNLLPSFHPALAEGDLLYEDLKHNYAYGFRNFPHEFHNGGLWQVWNGFLAAALVSAGKIEEANAVRNFLAEANFKNTTAEPWGFYENCHGLTFEPIGVQYCTWSASGQIIAGQTINGKKFIF